MQFDGAESEILHTKSKGQTQALRAAGCGVASSPCLASIDTHQVRCAHEVACYLEAAPRGSESSQQGECEALPQLRDARLHDMPCSLLTATAEVVLWWPHERQPGAPLPFCGVQGLQCTRGPQASQDILTLGMPLSMERKH